jgi:hypothetical protein
MISNFGSVNIQDGDKVSYEIIGRAEANNLSNDEIFSNRFDSNISYGDFFTLSGYSVAPWGNNNNLPTETRYLIRSNPFLPEILKKQVRILYGKGPYLYIEKDGDKKRERISVTDQYPEIMTWLDSWSKRGLDSIDIYSKKVMFDYFYNEGVFSQWHFNKSRIIKGKMPVAGLEYKSAERCRLGTQGILNRSLITEDSLFDKIIYNEWNRPYFKNALIYDRFDYSNPLASNTAISFVSDKASGEDIYPVPTSFFGLKEWIKGSNLNPKYINSYLKNSLNAKIHVKIPNAWIESKINSLERVIKRNQELEQQGKDIIKEFEGLEIGTSLDMSIIDTLIKKKINLATEVLSGEGKNQGKTFWSRTFLTEHGIEEWKFEDIPVKFQEFIKSLTEYDKRSLQVILAGKGLDPAISNVGNEGIFNSGAQVYYAYLVYLETQNYPEEFVCKDLQTAININFPKALKNRVKIGFLREVLPRQQEISPSDRMNNSNI